MRVASRRSELPDPFRAQSKKSSLHRSTTQKPPLILFLIEGSGAVEKVRARSILNAAVSWRRQIRYDDRQDWSKLDVRSRMRQMDTTAPKTIFITGATGLVGSHAAEEALKRGHRVLALVRRSSDTRWLDEWGVKTIVGDLEDNESLQAGVAGADWVFNCAAKVGDWGTLADFRRLNVDALRLLLEASGLAHVQRFVHVSSLGVYEGRNHFGTDETVPPAATSLDAYTRSKAEAEALVLEYHRMRGLATAIVRPGFIYGERDRTVLPKLLLNLRRFFAYFGSGQQVLNCIYVKNLVHGIFLAAENPAAVGEIFNLTDGQSVTRVQFVGRVAELAGLPPPRLHIPLPLARLLSNVVEGIAKRRGAKDPPIINRARYKFLALNLDFSIEKARRVLGYQPPFTFEQGIEQAMAEHRPPTPREPAVAVMP
jgi:nucleoside-diphosphate-sugar epimerase